MAKRFDDNTTLGAGAVMLADGGGAAGQNPPL